MARTRKQLEKCELARRLFIKKVRGRCILRTDVAQVDNTAMPLVAPKCFDKLVKAGITWGQVADPGDGSQIIYLDGPVPPEIMRMRGVSVLDASKLNWDELIPPWADKASGHFSYAHNALCAGEYFVDPYDPFGDNPDWTVYSKYPSGEDDQYESSGGELMPTASIPGLKYAYYKFDLADMSLITADYSVEAYEQISGGTRLGTGIVWLLGRFADTSTYYVLGLLKYLGAYILVIGTPAPGGGGVGVKGTSPFSNLGVIRLEMIGSVIKGYADEEEALLMSDTSFALPGHAGIYASGGNATSDFALDNLKVYTALSSSTPRLDLYKPAEDELDWADDVGENWNKLDIAPHRVVCVEKNGLAEAQADGTPGKPFGNLLQAYSYAKTLSPAASATQPVLIRLGAGVWQLAPVSNKGLDMDTSHIHLRGQGRGVSILTCSVAGSTTIDCAASVDASISSLSIRNAATSGTSYALNQGSSCDVAVLDCEISGSNSAKAINTASGTFRDCAISGGDPAIGTCSGEMEKCSIEATGTNADAVAATSSMVMSSCLCVATGSSGNSIAGSSVTPTLRGVMCEGDLASGVSPTSDSTWCVDGEWHTQGIKLDTDKALEFRDGDSTISSGEEGYLDLSAATAVRREVPVDPASAPSLTDDNTFAFYIDTTGDPDELKIVAQINSSTLTGTIDLT